MKNWHILALSLSVLMVLSLAGDAVAGVPGKVTNQRQNKQSNRIEQGVKSGEITRREAKNLARGQQRITHYETIARSDGRISGKEFKTLQNMQNNQNKAIYTQKHDNQDRD